MKQRTRAATTQGRRGRGRWPALALAALAALAAPALEPAWRLAPALAADWGGIVPGESTINNVRDWYGAPTRNTAQKVDGYDTTQWVYEGQRAPGGLIRMTVDFGLLTPSGYRPDLVRSLTIEPKPGVFTVDHVLQGWGIPDRETPTGTIAFFYEQGLLVYFADDGRTVTSMVFTPPQKAPAAGGTPR